MERKPECSRLALILLWQHLKLDPTPVLQVLQLPILINHAELISLAKTSKQWSKAIVQSKISVVIQGMGETANISTLVYFSYKSILFLSGETK